MPKKDHHIKQSLGIIFSKTKESSKKYGHIAAIKGKKYGGKAGRYALKHGKSGSKRLGRYAYEHGKTYAKKEAKAGFHWGVRAVKSNLGEMKQFAKEERRYDRAHPPVPAILEGYHTQRKKGKRHHSEIPISPFLR
jgi:hypothetical protein